MGYKEDGKFKNSQIVEEIKIEDLPETIVLYYAGQNERLKNYALKYEKAYLGKSGVNFTKKENLDIRNIFGLTTVHKNISMLLLLVYKNHFTKDILKRLENWKCGSIAAIKTINARTAIEVIAKIMLSASPAPFK